MLLCRVRSIGGGVTVGLMLGAASPVLAQDCNSNGVPGECDIDCGDPNGPCDVPGCGQSADCNENDVPDECEPDEDCNSNGTQDICDIAGGTSQDCNANGIPDECDISDCDGSARAGVYHRLFVETLMTPRCANHPWRSPRPPARSSGSITSLAGSSTHGAQDHD